MKRVFNIFVLVGFLLATVGNFAYAEHGKKECPNGDCPFKKSGYSDDEAYACPITDKFMSKARFFLKNQKELGLSEEQVDTIKKLKLEQKKAYIRQMSEHQIFELDMKDKLSETKVDTEGLGTMIDQFSGAMASGAKETVAAYAKLKSVLDEQQLEKAKALWLEGKS